MSTLHVKRKGTGIVIKYGSVVLALDTFHKNGVTFLSHSHSDHIGGIERASHVVATQGTLDTLRARGNRIHCKTSIISFSETYGQIGVYVTALNAGHVLGSTMFLFEFDDGLKVLYTGDFNTIDSLVHSAAKPVDADVLITEATFGTPSWVFPDRKQVHKDVISKAKEIIQNKHIPFFQAYSLGKAQEAIALLQGNGFNVISGNKAIDAVTEVYVKHGRELNYTPYNSDILDQIIEDDCVIVTASPYHTIRGLTKLLGKDLSIAIEMKMSKYQLSGWTLNQYGKMGYPLSAHTDFPGLIDFAKSVNPRIAYCFTGNAPILADHLSKEGIQSVPLE